jgi:hypothetical protein
MTRCKFKCDYKKEQYVSFSPVYSGSPENEQFFKATPGGQLHLCVVNDAAMRLFEHGKEYYIDITPAN